MKRRKKAAKELVDQLFDIGESAIKSGKMDGGSGAECSIPSR